jgi:hypothetical protein
LTVKAGIAAIARASPRPKTITIGGTPLARFFRATTGARMPGMPSMTPCR